MSTKQRCLIIASVLVGIALLSSIMMAVCMATLEETDEISEEGLDDGIRASDSEISTACRALASVGYDYWRLDEFATPERILEVAARIHSAAPGPEQARDFCNR